ncbi:unnamed protein product, partial [Meganyctiphanes norvegica]
DLRSTKQERGCVFPFRYNDLVFNSCTNLDANEPWCSTETDSRDNHVGNKWKYCQDSKPCIFPFTNNGNIYKSCREAGWCSTKTDGNHKHVAKYWKLCVKDLRSSKQERGCVFPFRYNDLVFNSCTTLDANDPWCSTETDSRDNHVEDKWKYCQDSKPCLVPFSNVAGVIYNSCRELGWCSTKTDGNHKHAPNYWKVC